MQTTIKKIIYPGKSLFHYEEIPIEKTTNETCGINKVDSGQKPPLAQSIKRQGPLTGFTDEGLPGELIEFQILQEKKNCVLAKTTKILQPSTNRVTTRCTHYHACSPYQYMDYPTQIQIKEAQIKEIFTHTLGEKLPDINTTPSPKIWEYRNKIRLHIIWKSGKPRFAYNVPDSYEEFIFVEHCYLVTEQINNVLKEFLKIIEKQKSYFIDEIEVKESQWKKDMILIVYSSSPNTPWLAMGMKAEEEQERSEGEAESDGYSATKEFRSEYPEFHLNNEKKLKYLTESIKQMALSSKIKGIIGLIKNKKSLKEYKLWGENFIEENICEKTFLIGPQSFFQINIPLLKILVEDIRKFLALTKKNKIADLYCGTGLFGICLSQYVKEVIGVESEPSNIYFLKSNLKTNKIDNFIIYEGRCEKLISKVLRQDVDTLILDPPRRGLSPSICKNILSKPVEHIIYISCNPVTLARDLKLIKPIYEVKSLNIYDFFPQTPHIETVAVLKKK